MRVTSEQNRDKRSYSDGESTLSTLAVLVEE